MQKTQLQKPFLRMGGLLGSPGRMFVTEHFCPLSRESGFFCCLKTRLGKIKF